MKRIFPLVAFLLIFIAAHSGAQPTDSLRNQIKRIAEKKHSVVGVSIIGNGGKDSLSLNGSKHFPMQSVFKFHIAIAMLSEIDKGKFTLDQKIEIQKKDLLYDFYSPIRDKFPEGTTLTLAEILQYTVSHSDNVGCDLLLRMLDGPLAVENYFTGYGFDDISIKINEEVMQKNWDMQFQNWTTPETASRILDVFYQNNNALLSQSSHDFLWRIMRETSTGMKRLKGKLPDGTVVMHKTGWSGTNESTGITAAVNDIGIIFLPDGRYFVISVFITESKENIATNDELAADIAKAAWDYFVSQ